jgi:hypothetical protein
MHQRLHLFRAVADTEPHNICPSFCLGAIKVQSSLSMPWRHMRGVKIELHSFLTSAMNGGKGSVSCPGHYMPEERGPGTH